MAVKETPKRLTPKAKTLRELYLKSGNRCAFPACEEQLLNNEGVFVAQVCHIEAAEPGGERFNEKQTNEERRQASNLMLMCYPHHKITNNISEYLAPRMQEIKKAHEEKFADVAKAITVAIKDNAAEATPMYAKTLNKMNDLFKWGLSVEDLRVCIVETEELINRLARLPVPARQLFEVIVSRAKVRSHISGLVVSSSEIKQATELGLDTLKGFYSTLDEHGFTIDAGTNDFEVQVIGVRSLNSGWVFWQDIKDFCKIQNIPLRQVIVNLDFSVLD